MSSWNVRCTKDCPASHEKYEGRGWRRCHRNGTQPISSRIRTYHQRQTAVGDQLLCTCLRGAQSRRAMCSRFREFGIGCCSPLKIHTQTPFKHISDSIFDVIYKKRNIPDPLSKPSLICVFGCYQLFGRLSQVIPMTLAQNSGADGTKVLNQLRQKHAAAGPEGRWWGVDCMNCTVGLAWFKELFFLCFIAIHVEE